MGTVNLRFLTGVVLTRVCSVRKKSSGMLGIYVLISVCFISIKFSTTQPKPAAFWELRKPHHGCFSAWVVFSFVNASGPHEAQLHLLQALRNRVGSTQRPAGRLIYFCAKPYPLRRLPPENQSVPMCARVSGWPSALEMSSLLYYLT